MSLACPKCRSANTVRHTTRWVCHSCGIPFLDPSAPVGAAEDLTHPEPSARPAGDPCRSCGGSGRTGPVGAGHSCLTCRGTGRRR